MKAHITKHRVDQIKEPCILWDDETPRFGVKTSAGGVKSFILDYTTAAGRRRRLTIGRYGVLTVEQAREQAIQTLAQVIAGADPLDKRQAVRTGPTIREFMPEYKAHCQKRQKLATYEVTEIVLNIIDRELGGLKLTAVTQDDAAGLHESMENTPAMANKVLSRLSHMFTVAKVPNVTKGIPRYPETERQRYLSDEELARLGAVLIALEGRSRATSKKVLAVRLLLLTGCRLMEVMSARWSDIHLDRSLLHLPDSKTGRGDVALGRAAIELLSGVPRDESEWVFPSRQGGHLTKATMELFWREVRPLAGLEDVRLHDLRHTVGSVGAIDGIAMMHIRGVLRHAKVATTERYAHLSRGVVHEAADHISDHIAAALSAPVPEDAPVIPITEGRRRKKA